MAQGVTGTINVVGTKGSKGQIIYSEQYDLNNNTSVLSVDVLIGNEWAGYRYWLNGYIKVNGATIVEFNSYTGTHYAGVGSTVGYYPITAESAEYPSPPWSSASIQHNADGSKSVNIEVNITGYVDSQNTPITQGWNIVNTTTVNLTTIPRASSLVVAGGALGSPVSLTIQRASSAFKHTITYTCGSASGTIATDTSSTALSFTPPISLAAQNTTGNSVTVSFTLKTISGGAVIGTTTAQATYSIPASVKPAVTSGWATVAPYNVGTKVAGISAYIQSFSRTQITFDSSKINMSGAYGATISRYEVMFNGSTISASPYRTQILNNAGQMYITCIVYDSRGRYAEQTLTFTVQAYSLPGLSGIEIFRSNSSGVESDSGTYISVKATASYSPIGTTPILNARYAQASGAYGSPIALTSGVSAVIGGGLIGVSTSYKVLITLTDGIGNATTYEAVVPTEEVTYQQKDGGHGAAFGKYAENDYELDIAENWKLHVRGEVKFDKYRLSNRNLLDNPFFTINQRGWTTGTVQNGGYTADRWYCGGYEQDITINSSGISIGKRPWFMQMFEDCTAFIGKTMTASIKFQNGEILSGTLDVVSGSNSFFSFTNGGIDCSVELNTQDKYFRIVTYSSSLMSSPLPIRAVKLEYGSVSTLANDSAPDYATELLKCQTDLFVIPSYGDYIVPIASGFCTSTSRARFAIILPTKMRTTPVMTSTVNSLRIRSNGSVFTPTTISVLQVRNNILWIQADATGLTTSQPAVLDATGAPSVPQYIAFSAER